MKKWYYIEVGWDGFGQWFRAYAIEASVVEAGAWSTVRWEQAGVIAGCPDEGYVHEVAQARGYQLLGS